MEQTNNYDSIPRCCGSCVHLFKKCTEEPCMNCYRASEWIPNENLRSEVENNG